MQLDSYWVSASFVVVATIVILRVIVRRDYLQKGKLTPVSSAMEWLLGIIWATFSSIYLPSDWPAMHVIHALLWAGWVLISIGILIMFTSLAWLGLRRTHGLEADTLVMTGPYGYTRNPQLVGFLLSMVGFVMVWPSWHMGVSLSLLLVLAHLMVLTEEEHLLHRHGDEYRFYCEQVPRYVGLPKMNPVVNI